MITSLCGNLMLALTAVAFVGHQYLSVRSVQAPAVSRHSILAAGLEGYRMIHLNAFTIKLPENPAFDFLSMSFAMALQPEHAISVSKEKIRQVRASIYDEVSQGIKENHVTMSIVPIRKLILAIIQQHAVFANIKKVYVTEFYAI